ncbi:quinone oxidoreductase-like, partial [Physella acuta]|uniref:quinone oxidoreductase-like n=1 Tax=Physella acuta TaxID=109671 RepID=UPI0027DC8A14
MTMRAVTIKKFGGPEELALETVAVPTPKEGEVLIRVHAIGVNPVDTIIRQGWFGPRTFPFILGMDVAGVIEKVGPGVKGYKAGDRVYTFDTVSGGYAEFAVASVTRIGRFDNKLSFAQGAALGVPYHTAWKSLYFRAQAKKEETILIHGASGAVSIWGGSGA